MMETQKVVAKWLDDGGDVDAHMEDERVTLLMLAAAADRERLVELLITRGADLDKLCGMGCTALTYAAFDGSVTIVRRLLCAGANAAHSSKDGNTPLDAAMKMDHREVAGVLVALAAWTAALLA